MSEDEEWLSKADAAKILGITPAGVLLLEQRGQLRALRTRGGIRLFREADVSELASKRNLERAERERRASEAARR